MSEPDRQEMKPGGGGEPEGVGVGETPGAGRVAPGRATARARDREPGGPGEREGGGVEPEQAAPLEVGGRITSGSRGKSAARSGRGTTCEPGAGGACGQDRVAGIREAAGTGGREMNPQREEREAIPAGRDGWGGPERERVAWQRAEERTHWARFEQAA